MEVGEERSGEEKRGKGRSEYGRREDGEDRRKGNRGEGEEEGEIKGRGGERRLTRGKIHSLKSQPQQSVCSS